MSHLVIVFILLMKISKHGRHRHYDEDEFNLVDASFICFQQFVVQELCIEYFTVYKQ